MHYTVLSSGYFGDGWCVYTILFAIQNSMFKLGLYRDMNSVLYMYLTHSGQGSIYC
ncbi:hypothetical protein BT96DRAFT_912109 [Gymnopus androsaceus JB14]|uniref:Uncharacterized protein n=1 Tax=Gymnopus androsaceus JB14 TaxID=1447944 RepID=A0A6A4IUQ0_9AGAR|nr:hypothetical protein BT96DRAFT_912109 [Gymnopus androsaceus JB14]